LAKAGCGGYNPADFPGDVMTIAAPTRTTDQLLAMPDDGKDRWLINGEIREKEMTRRNKHHSSAEPKFAHFLIAWNETQPEPRGRVYSGEVGVRLRKDPDSTVGIDVAYFSAETIAASRAEYRFIDGVPVLAIEILSPSDQIEEISEKVRAYLEAGVKRVWIADPQFKTVTVHRPDAEPELFNVTQTLDGGDALPGLRIALKDVFNG
jgi:Uma2 family endonuclease